MAFGLGKLAVLESKLDIYEDLSKEMLDKLERAVGTISENSNKVAIILERHENRLDESDKISKHCRPLFDSQFHQKVPYQIHLLSLQFQHLYLMVRVGIKKFLKTLRLQHPFL